MNRQKKPTAVIYSRVSTNEQDYSRQTAELKTYAAAYGYTIIAVFEEKLSGKNTDRPELQKMLKLVETEKINHVLSYDLSRIGRSTTDVISIIDQLTALECSLTIKKLNITTLDQNKKMSAECTAFLTIFSAIDQLERSTIRERMKSGYNHYLKNGGKVGRSVGYVKPIEQMNYYSEIKRELRAEKSIRNTQAILEKVNKKVSLGSVAKVRNYLVQTKQLTA